MAIPKVFISSTCYDLLQIRDSLFDFITEQYLEPVLSEKGDVFFHPDLHTHESCIDEIDNCQLFILIIGGRFGGKYKYDPSKSITNAEYEAAVNKNIPVYTFIKREVYEDHRLYQSNKSDEKLVKKIVFPSIEKQDYAIKIFEFINKVRLSNVNNGFFTFELVKEIKENLGKQWSGLLFNYLVERKINNENKVNKRTLDNLTLINKKTEELVESILKELKPKLGNQQIKKTDNLINLAKFYNSVLELAGVSEFDKPINELKKVNPKNKAWYQYIIGLFDSEVVLKEDSPFKDDLEFEAISYIHIKNSNKYIAAERTDKPKNKTLRKVIELFELVEKSSFEQRKLALEMTDANNS